MTSARFSEEEFEPPLAQQLEHWLKENPNGPFSDKLLKQFERLKHEQPLLFARLYRRYPALAAAIKLDAATVRAALEKASKDEVVELFIKLALAGNLNPVEIDALTRLAAKKAGVGLRPLSRLLEQAQDEQAKQRAEEAEAQWLAQRTDPRPEVCVPKDKDPWIPVMDEVNAVIGVSQKTVPPARDIDRVATRLRKLSVPKMHAFDQTQANPGDDDHD